MHEQPSQSPIPAREVQHPSRTPITPARNVPNQRKLIERILEVVRHRRVAIVMEQLHREIEHVVALVDRTIELAPPRHARAQQRIHHRMRFVVLKRQGHGRRGK
ncbi:MAG TPA: hypothetical protein VGQ76_11825 [Thermoanaerobaculia bacterium]|nr:hypothetical protein [Thermoanaerobaculia bacterium]